MLMTRGIPIGGCPNCGKENFLVKDIESNLFLTNRDGEIIDSKEEIHICVGKCISCGREYNMFPGYNKYIPITPLRALLYEYQPEYLEKTNDKFDDIKNPMGK